MSVPSLLLLVFVRVSVWLVGGLFFRVSIFSFFFHFLSFRFKLFSGGLDSRISYLRSLLTSRPKNVERVRVSSLFASTLVSI